MGQDQWKSFRFPRAHVQKMHLSAVDLCGELRKLVEGCLLLAPVVLGEPIAGQIFQVAKRHSSGPAYPRYLLRPAGAGKAVSQIVQIRLTDVDMKRSNHAVSRNSQFLASQIFGAI